MYQPDRAQTLSNVLTSSTLYLLLFNVVIILFENSKVAPMIDKGYGKMELNKLKPRKKNFYCQI